MNPDEKQGTVTTDWRPELVDGMSLAMCILVAMGMPVVVFELQSASIGVVAIALWLFLSSSWATRKHTPLWYRTSALVLTGYCVMVSGYLLAGTLVGPTLAATMSVIVMLLVYGPRAGLAMHLGIVVTMLALGLAIFLGWVTPPPPDGASMNPPTAWIREGIGFGIFGGALLVAIGQVVRRIEAARAQTEDVLMRLQQEQAQKAETERALAESDRTVQELQRLEALGRLAGGVAHDFNNALTVLMGGTEALADTLLTQDEQEILDDMYQAIQGATQLTEQLLMYGRRDVITPKSVAVSELLHSVARSMSRILPEDIELQLELGETPAVFVDASQLHHAILNLALNARDAMPTGGVIVLSSSVENGDDSHVTIGVSDNGQGMSDEVQGRVFEPFFTTKASGMGTGLGLPMVMSIVKRWGGTLSIDSATDAGTRVQFTVPSAEATDEIHAEVVLPMAVQTSVILLAEDEPLVRKTMVSALRDRGHVVVEVRDGDEAMAALVSPDEPFDLLCIDGVMPGASCKSVIDRFRTTHPDRPVLVCSGYLAEELVRRQISEGETEYLAKPFSGDELVIRIESLL